MTDPFEVLREPVTPADPDPEFTVSLRQRLQRALRLPEGVAVSDVTATMEQRSQPPGPSRAAPRGAAVPYLAVRDARRAIRWYVDVLGARQRGEPVVMPGGRVGHAELELAGGLLYLADEHPEIGVRAPTPGAASVSLVLAVPDADRALATATDSGATLDRPPYDDYGHRNVWVIDPFGHRWLLQGPVPGQSPQHGGDEEMPLREGDISFVSLGLPDVERAAAFYTAVLGWEYDPGHDASGLLVRGVRPPHGLQGGARQPGLSCSYVVSDIAAATARVRAAGGQAGAPFRRRYGTVAECTDPDGARFLLHEPPGALTPPAPPQAAAAPQAPATRHGDLVYVTLETRDSARAREFYAAVLGWRTRPGRAPGRWQVEGTTPLVGISGGHASAGSAPMWQVADIGAAVAAVRAAGGTAAGPRHEDYGHMAECTDDQGTHFYLGQFPSGG